MGNDSDPNGMTAADRVPTSDKGGDVSGFRQALREMALRGDMRLTANQRRHLTPPARGLS